MVRSIDDMIEEIKGICIGCFSPEAIVNGEENPKDELEKCRQDLNRISDVIEEIEKRLDENEGGE
jgi:hypothetical protein